MPRDSSAPDGQVVDRIEDDRAWAERSSFWLEDARTQPRKRRAKTDTREPLILSGHGVSLRVDSGTLLIRNGFTHYPQQREEWRLFPGHWRHPSRIVVLDADGGLSFDVLAWLSAQAIPLIQINWRGEALQVVGGTGSAIDRRLVDKQLAARTNGLGLKLAQRLIAEKIVSSIDTLRHAFPALEAAESAIQKLERDAYLLTRQPPGAMHELLGIEGRVAEAYFGAWRSYPLRWKGTGQRPVPEDWKQIGPRLSRVSGKSHRNRNATHPVNAMLNYAYSVLESEVRAQVLAAGLDPTIGYLHGSYRGKHALVFDLMEPLRPVVDRSVLQSVQNRALEPGDFTMRPDGICRLNPGLAVCLVRSQQDALKTQGIVIHSVEALSAIA
jgi:CRISPR-associated endonuclease Cas1